MPPMDSYTDGKMKTLRFAKVPFLLLLMVLMLLNGQETNGLRIRRQAGKSKTRTATSGASCTTPQSEAGVCKEVKSCTSIYNLALNRGRETEVADYLRKFQCTSGSSTGYNVCCPNSGVVTYPPEVAISSTTTQSSSSTSTCGVSGKKTTRIVGGQNSTLGDWPWIAALGYETPGAPFDYKCGGALITSQHVITAAHCVSNLGTIKLTSVRLGDLNLDPDVYDGASPVDIDVSETIAHPSYTTSPILNDIAILKLEKSVQFTDLIHPICLPEAEEYKNNSFYDKKRPFIIGWGAVEWRGASSKMLQETSMNVVDNTKCATAFANQRSAKIDNSIICAGQPGKDSCQGDSGGPLMMPTNSLYYLIGVVSYGYKCAEPNYPGVYTKVSYFVDWIRQNTN